MLKLFIEIIKDNKCVQVETFIKNKWTLLCTWYEISYMQFDFTMSIYILNNKPIIVFNRIGDIDNYTELYEFIHKSYNGYDKIASEVDIKYH